MVDNKDGTYTVTYVPLTSGMCTLLLKYGGKVVPGFPVKVMVEPAVDTSKVKVLGPGVQAQGTLRPPGPSAGRQREENLVSSLQGFSEKPPPCSRWTLAP